MSNTFDFVGSLRTNKEKPALEVKVSKKGIWETHTLNFMMLCGGNSQFLKIEDGKFVDGKGTNKIFTYTKSENGTKGQKLEVAWDKRKDPEVIDKIAGFRKYYIDLGSDSATFITAYDFIEAMNEILKNPTFENRIFHVTGEIEYSYSTSKNRWYSAYVPKKVEIIPEGADVEEHCNGTVTLYYTNDNIDDNGDPRKAITFSGNAGENAKISGYTRYYDERAKGNYFAPITLDIATDNMAKFEAIKKYLALDSEKDVKSIGFTVKYIRGSVKTETVDETTLTDEDKLNIELGLVDLETLKAERRGAYGPKIEAILVDKFLKGYTKGAKEEETLTPSDLRQVPVVTFASDDETGVSGATDAPAPDDNFDLFEL